MVARWGWPIGRVVLVLGPSGGVVHDVLTDASEIVFVTDDMFVVVALPDGCVRCAPEAVDAFSGAGLEGADDLAEGVGLERSGV